MITGGANKARRIRADEELFEITPDGERPISLSDASELGRVRQEARRYLLVARPSTRTEAANVAERAGGHLAVTSQLDEAIWLEDYLAKERIAGGTWLLRSSQRDGIEQIGELSGN